MPWQNSRTSSLDEPADLSAPVGSRSWALAVAREIHCLFQELGSTVEHGQTMLRLAKDKGAFTALGYITFEAMLVEACKVNPDDALAILAAKPGQTIRQALNQRMEKAMSQVATTRVADKPEGGDSTVYKNDNYTPLPKGTSSARRIACLKRDCPEAATRLEQGEFKSVAAAVRWSKGEEPHPKRRTASTLEILQRYWSKASKKEKDAFMDWANESGW